MGEVPLSNFGVPHLVHVVEEDAAHGGPLGSAVEVFGKYAIALLLPPAVAGFRAGSHPAGRADCRPAPQRLPANALDSLQVHLHEIPHIEGGLHPLPHILHNPH